MAFNILLVDDSRIMRDVIAKTLRLAEVPVNALYQAENGKEALAILNEQWVDLVFTDINMPVMDGVELIEHMSDDGLMHTIPVVVVSTEGSATRIEQLRAKGIRAYLRKPFAPETLRDVVSSIMEGGDAGAEYQGLVSEAFLQVLEKLAYMFADSACPRDLADAPDNAIAVEMRFSGACQGEIALAVSRAMSLEVAANVLGLEPGTEVAGEQGIDAIKEILNITCGHVLTALAGAQPVCALGVPAVSAIDQGVWQAMLMSPATQGFWVEGKPALLRFEVARQATATGVGIYRAQRMA